MFGKTLIYYVTTSLLAIITGILMVNVVRPGVGADLPGGGGVVSGPGEESIGGIFVELINKMVPTNPIQSLAGACLSFRPEERVAKHCATSFSQALTS